MELEDAGGIEILSDTLKDENATEEEKSEAAGLLAQVTSPWIENNNTIEGLSRHLNDLVQSLTSKLLYDSQWLLKILKKKCANSCKDYIKNLIAITRIQQFRFFASKSSLKSKIFHFVSLKKLS